MGFTLVMVLSLAFEVILLWKMHTLSLYVSSLEGRRKQAIWGIGDPL